MELTTEPPKSPEEIFPLEVWGLILDNLEVASDLQSCYQTCKAWAELLKPKRTTFLMSKVFPILYEKGYLEPDKLEDEHAEVAYDYFPAGEQTEVLKMRLVSRSWKESVDAYFHNHPEHCDIGFGNDKEEDEENYEENDEAFALLPYHFNWKNDAKLESFLAMNFAPDSNPFITRYVKFDDGVDYQEKRLQRRLRTNFKKMLQSFGSQIWTCSLHFNCIDTSLAELYKLVRSYLTLIPNVRYLTFSVSGSYEKKKKGSSPKQLEMLLQREPFPKLEHLSTLYMNGVPFPLNVGILTRNDHVRKLSLNGEYPQGHIPDSIVNVEIPHLEELAMEPCYELDLMQMQKVTWPLKVISLSVEVEELATIFTAVSTFKNTLEHLYLLRGNVEDNSTLEELRLEMPKLKKLFLEIPQEVLAIDFLVGCTALQEIELSIFIPYTNEESDGETENKRDESSTSSTLSENEGDAPVIQFDSCITSLRKSKIWELLPVLQLVKIKARGIKKFTWNRLILYPNVLTNYRFTRRQREKYVQELKTIA